MKVDRSLTLLLVVVALLLAANLVQPIMSPTAVHAEDYEGVDSQITGSGMTAWVLRGNEVFYLKFEQQFESIRVYGPEELED